MVVAKLPRPTIYIELQQQLSSKIFKMARISNLSQMYPPAPGYTENDIPDLTGKVCLPHSYYHCNNDPQNAHNEIRSIS